jgi:predicted ester cyclase
MGNEAEVVERLIAAFNSHRVEELGALYAETARTRRPGWPSEGGIDDLMASYRMDIAAVPDLRLDALSTMADPPNVCTELRITGTNTGPTALGDFGRALTGSDVNELPPSGRAIDLNAVFVHEVRDERVVAERQYWGLLEYLVQVGVLGGGAAPQ